MPFIFSFSIFNTFSWQLANWIGELDLEAISISTGDGSQAP